VPHPFRFFLRKGWETTKARGIGFFGGRSNSPRQFVNAHSYRLPKIHGRLAQVGGDFDEGVAPGKVFARKAMLLRSEDQGDAASGRESWRENSGQIGERNHRLFRLAMGARTGAGHKRAVRHGLGKGTGLSRALQQFGRAYRGASLAPMRCVWRNDGQARETEVGQGARRRTDVERIAR